jgi:hypothetical protein
VEELLEGPKDELPEDLDQPVKRATEENVKHSNGHLTFCSSLQDLRKLVDTSLGPFNGHGHQICSTNRTGLRAYHMMFKEMNEKTKQLPSEYFWKEQKLRPVKVSLKIILKERRN